VTGIADLVRCTMAFDDGVKTGPIAYIGLVSVIVTFIIVLLLQVLYFGQAEERQTAALAAQDRPAELSDLTATQLTALTRRDVVDRDRGIVTIGIAHAMELVVKELAAGKTPADVMGPALPGTSPAAKPGAPVGGEPAATPAQAQPAAPQRPVDTVEPKSEPAQEQNNDAHT
jgi:hypothetical protein